MVVAPAPKTGAGAAPEAWLAWLATCLTAVAPVLVMPVSLNTEIPPPLVTPAASEKVVLPAVTIVAVLTQTSIKSALVALSALVANT